MKTQWTGNLTVPETAVEDGRSPRSKLPLVIGAAVVIAGGGIAAFLAMGGGKPGSTPAPRIRWALRD